ncbi:MAG TPA: TonB-dependent receptor, partial [Woeseiaceae bacterium]|nr:TonB-dependent receptor [Woeseiaceae bacterium]
SFFQFQRSKTDEDIAGQLSSLRLALGSDVIIDPDTGEARCRNEFVGCVPVNFLGIDAVTPEAAAFISPNHGVTDVLERTVYGASITGDLFELPAGPLAVAFGVEHRAEEYDFRPDTAAQGGEFGDPQPPIFGEFDLTELYVETRVPLLEGAPMAEYLGLELAGRTSDYSNVGRVFTWKAGGEWAPSDWMRFRGAYNVAIRAPNLNELFATQATGFAAGDDPCDKDFNPSQAVKDLCVAQGVLPGDIDTFDQINVGFDTQSGGNPDLREEESDTWTVGFVVSPPFAEGLNVAIDYYNIEIENAIDELSAQQIVNSCFRQLDNSAETCQAIHRFPNGQIDFVSATLKNIASLKASGLDLQADYVFDLPDSLAFLEDSAQMNLQFVASWGFENETVSEPGQPGLDCLGHFGGACSGFNVFMQPDAKYIFNATYLSGPFTGRFQARHIPGLTLVEGATNVIPSVSSKTYLDLNVDYLFNDWLTLFFGVDNVADTEPPIVGFSLAGDANVDISLYDVVGRRYFAGVRFTY